MNTSMNVATVDWSFAVFLPVCFLTVVLLVTGVHLLWRDKRGADARLLARRLAALDEGQRAQARSSMIRTNEGERTSRLGNLLLRLPRTSTLEPALRRAGVAVSASSFLGTVALLAAASLLVLLVLGQPFLVALGVGVFAAFLPFVWLSWKRAGRMKRLEAQLPDAVELIARALRAGHAFPPALQMVAEEMPDPIASEFATAFEEISYGIPVPEALGSLADRVPIDDLRFFSVAVILQRETGGNLAEILDNISTLVRERFKLLGTVRVLSAEGKLSAWILSLLPFAAALMLNLVSPGFMDVLWDDPAGIQLIFAALFAMCLGVVWMWRVVKIRV
jgi:tight adherence protein B